MLGELLVFIYLYDVGFVGNDNASIWMHLCLEF